MGCNHQAAKCVESTEPKDSGRFKERYKCPCGATGVITGQEDELPENWDRIGEVFN